MAFLNDNSDFYSSTSADGNFDLQPVPSLASATGAVTTRTFDASSYLQGAVEPNYLDTSCPWGTTDKPGFAAGPPCSGRTKNSHDLVDLATPCLTGTDDYAQPSRPCLGEHSSEPRYRTRSFTLLGWDGSPTTPEVLEAPTPILAPTDLPLDYGSNTQGGVDVQTKSPSPCATDSFQPLDVPTPYQPDTDATRVKQSQAERFLPYPRPRTRGTEHTNAEAGPSTLPPPHIPSVDPSTIQPSGEESETTADAEQSYSNVEEDEVMNPTKTRVPRGEGKPRKCRVLMKDLTDRLHQSHWVLRKTSHLSRVSYLSALTAAAEAIPTIREVVNKEPFLLEAETIGKSVSERGETARENRNKERRLYRELSRYYLRAKGPWQTQLLLSEVVEDLESHPDLQ